jgi:hypothetical protein
MPARRALAVLVSVLAVALSACTTPQGAESTASRSGSSTQPIVHALWDRLGGTGFVYFQANTDGKKHYELFRVDHATGEETQVTDLPGPFGISNFSVSSSGLVVADASSMIDQAAWVNTDGTLVQLPGPRVLGPSVNDAGDVVASIVAGRRAQLAVLRDGYERWQRVDAPMKGWTLSWWHDDDSLILLRIGRHRTTWRLIDLDGERTRWRPVGGRGIYLRSSMATHDGQPVMLRSRTADSTLLWAAGRRPRRLPSGWQQGCMSPDDSRLLLMRDGVLGSIGIHNLRGTVEEIGTYSTDILGCGWVEEKYGP